MIYVESQPCGEPEFVPDDLDAIRHELTVLAHRSKAWVTAWSRDMPTEWQPHTVENPATGMPYSDVGARDLIASLLESGHPIKEIELRNPPGKKAYQMEYFLQDNRPPVYIKVQLGSGKIIGRSFHYSKITPPRNQGTLQ